MTTNDTYEQVYQDTDSPIKKVFPQANNTMWFGISSLISFICCCIPNPYASNAGIFIPLTLAIITLVYASYAKKTFLQNPELYLPNTLSNIKTGKICAYISLSLSILFACFIIGLIALIGIEVFTQILNGEVNQEEIQRILQDIVNNQG